MNRCTALILVPEPPEPEFEETLETIGPFGPIEVNLKPGWNLGADYTFPRPDAPTRPQRSPRCRSSYEIDQANTRRIVALVDTFTAGDAQVKRAIAEIRRRVLTLCPLVEFQPPATEANALRCHATRSDG